MISRRRTNRRRSKLLFAAVALVFCSVALARQPQEDVEETSYHARVPLGAQGFFLRPARRTLYLLSTAHSAAFEGMRVLGSGSKKVITAGDGAPVKVFPRAISFRVTATTQLPQLLEVDRDFLDLPDDDINRFLLDLSFRVKIFHGLGVTSVAPEAVEIIGMPASVPYEERVWRASFILPADVPIEDRIVLEVLRRDGERLCKFHLEF